ncbi:MAG: DUF1800 domain-containing protein [Parasphingopyxis sp.]|uniref:DUF1800 domain-containing protein n=1 Tax=Parasphingopyxis sp. TaxID=1920299 RepID=UPI0032F00420
MPNSVIAVNRFGLGGRPDDRLPGDPERWLLDQFARYDPVSAPIAVAPRHRDVMRYFGESTGEFLVESERIREINLAARDGEAMPAMDDRRAEMRRAMLRQGRDFHEAHIAARVASALTSTTPFIERLVHFWANHFAVSIDKRETLGYAGLLEFDAIRPHVLGRFEDMLLAVEQHPAMLLYLDQPTSIGPASEFGARLGNRPRRTLGLNENLAREVLELHTLGVDGGYDQTDVTEFARALTGWTVNGLMRQRYITRFLSPDAAPGSFAFAPELHEPGVRRIMGQSYDQAGAAQARAVLRDLARHPSTARHLATKLARHFAGDEPPPALIDRLASAYRSNDGDLSAVYRALIASPEAWVEQPVKFKTPWEWQVSASRALGQDALPDTNVTRLFTQLGQPVWESGSPAGYDDLAGPWAVPDALVRRVERAGAMVRAAADGRDPRQLAEALFADRLSTATAQTIAQAESNGQGLALLLVSPEFQRR